MKLIDLEPRWFNSSDGELHGFTMLCPHCKETRLGVNTTVDGAKHMHDYQLLELDDPELHVAPKQGRCWNMSGSSFDDITISPSVDASASGHWHGFIRNGQIITV